MRVPHVCEWYDACVLPCTMYVRADECRLVESERWSQRTAVDVPVVSRYVSQAPRPPPPPAGAGDSAGPRTRRCERGGVWCSGVCPTAPQHAACGVWRESGEDSDRARGRRPEAERIAVIRAASRSPAPARVSGMVSRGTMRDENDATTAVSCLTVLQAKPDVIMCEPRCASSGIGVV